MQFTEQRGYYRAFPYLIAAAAAAKGGDAVGYFSRVVSRIIRTMTNTDRFSDRQLLQRPDLLRTRR
ncbi:MAG: hypothetical protein ACRYHA_22925 [Janthinobacterium lividum]